MDIYIYVLVYLRVMHFKIRTKNVWAYVYECLIVVQA